MQGVWLSRTIPAIEGVVESSTRHESELEQVATMDYVLEENQSAFFEEFAGKRPGVNASPALKDTDAKWTDADDIDKAVLKVKAPAKTKGQDDSDEDPMEALWGTSAPTALGGDEDSDSDEEGIGAADHKKKKKKKAPKVKQEIEKAKPKAKAKAKDGGISLAKSTAADPQNYKFRLKLQGAIRSASSASVEAGQVLSNLANDNFDHSILLKHWTSASNKVKSALEKSDVLSAGCVEQYVSDAAPTEGMEALNTLRGHRSQLIAVESYIRSQGEESTSAEILLGHLIAAKQANVKIAASCYEKVVARHTNDMCDKRQYQEAVDVISFGGMDEVVAGAKNCVPCIGLGLVECPEKRAKLQESIAMRRVFEVFRTADTKATECCSTIANFNIFLAAMITLKADPTNGTLVESFCDLHALSFPLRNDVVTKEDAAQVKEAHRKIVMDKEHRMHKLVHQFDIGEYINGKANACILQSGIDEAGDPELQKHLEAISKLVATAVDDFLVRYAAASSPIKPPIDDAFAKLADQVEECKQLLSTCSDAFKAGKIPIIKTAQTKPAPKQSRANKNGTNPDQPKTGTTNNGTVLNKRRYTTCTKQNGNPKQNGAKQQWYQQKNDSKQTRYPQQTVRPPHT